LEWRALRSAVAKEKEKAEIQTAELRARG